MLPAIVGRFPLLHTARLAFAECQSHGINTLGDMIGVQFYIDLWGDGNPLPHFSLLNILIESFFCNLSTFFRKPIEILFFICYNTIINVKIAIIPPERIQNALLYRKSRTDHPSGCRPARHGRIPLCSD